MSSFGALIISNWQAPPQRELLIATESMGENGQLSHFPHWNWKKTVFVITIEWSVCSWMRAG